jgi:curved DNA-binding protein CbpA
MDPFEILGVPRDAGDDAIRAAYLARVRECPPDRSPEQFERVRDAYEKLRDPRARIRHRLFSVDPAAPLTSVFAELAPPRRFVGPGPWLEVLKGK